MDKVEQEILLSRNTIIDDPNKEVATVIETVTNILDQSKQEKSLQVALNGVKTLLRVVKASGMGLIHFTAGIRNNWHLYEDVDPDEDFVEVYQRETGLNYYTIQRHLDVYDQIIDNNEVPEELRDVILKRNVKDLTRVAQAMRDGHFFSDDEWKKIATAGTHEEVSRIVRATRGEAPRKNAKIVTLSKDGTLRVTNQGKTFFVGYLDVQSSHEVVQEIITRITNHSGIVRRF